MPVEAPQTMDELKAIPKEIKAPCLFNYVEGGKTPDCDMKTVADMGFRLAILPGVLLRGESPGLVRMEQGRRLHRNDDGQREGRIHFA